MASFAAAVELRKKKPKKIKKESKEDQKVETKKTRAEIRSEKYKRIKRMRGKPNFDDLEKNLRYVDGIDESKITLCSDTTCGNKGNVL